MKQRIEPEQLKELTPEQQEHLRELWEPKTCDVVWLYEKWEEVIYVQSDGQILQFNVEEPENIPKDDLLPILSIGQMIEILIDEDFDYSYACHDSLDKKEKLCDALWEAVKAVL